LKKKAPPGPAEPGKKSFHRHVERAIAHNAGAKEDKRRHVQIHYQKLNGRTVKRKVTPYAMKGNVMVGFDHKRKETRSYRMERVKHMEKSANTVMDTLRRVAKTPAGRGAIVGSVTGGLGNAGMAPEGHRLKQGLKGALVGAGAGAAAGQLMHKLSSDFWAGFEKSAGAISDAMKRLGVNHPHLRKSMADQIRKGRRELLHEHGMAGHSHRGKLLGDQLQADIEHGGKSISVEHAASGLPAAMIERAEGKRRISHPGAEAGRFDKKASAFAHAAELGGLGLLAHGSAKHLSGKPLSEDRSHKEELAGLGILATPSLHAAAVGTRDAFRAAHQGSKGVIGAEARARGAWKAFKKWHQATGH